MDSGRFGGESTVPLNQLSAWSMAILLGAIAPLAQAQDAPGDWRQTVFLYGMGATIDGDVTYMNLGSSQTTQQGNASAGLDTEQWTAMATLGRRIAPNLEALLSLAYFDVSADLRVRLLRQVRTASRNANWVDPLLGLNYEIPVSGK